MSAGGEIYQESCEARVKEISSLVFNFDRSWFGPPRVFNAVHGQVVTHTAQLCGRILCE